jgi:hypothetical protein
MLLLCRLFRYRFCAAEGELPLRNIKILTKIGSTLTQCRTTGERRARERAEAHAANNSGVEEDEGILPPSSSISEDNAATPSRSVTLDQFQAQCS